MITMKVMTRTAFLALGLGGMAALASGCVEHRVVYVPAPPAQAAYAGPAPAAGAPPPQAYAGPAPTEPSAAPAPAPQAAPEAAQAPPAPQAEVVPPSPGPTYVWTPGYWYWGPVGWVWVGGRVRGRAVSSRHVGRAALGEARPRLRVGARILAVAPPKWRAALRRQIRLSKWQKKVCGRSGACV